MLNRLLGLSRNVNEAPAITGTHVGSGGSGQTGSESNGSANRADEQPKGGSQPSRVVEIGERGTTWSAPANFDQIYQSAAFKIPQIAFGILKVADLAHSPHLSGMPTENKCSALQMALEAMGAEIPILLQDAVARQRALDDYEAHLKEKLTQFEAAKEEENRLQQTELERISAQYRVRIQANLDEIARSQDSFRGWQKRKQQEAQRIAETAGLCVPQGSGADRNGGLTAVLERAATACR